MDFHTGPTLSITIDIIRNRIGNLSRERMPPYTIPARTPCYHDQHREGVRGGARLRLKYTLDGEDSGKVKVTCGTVEREPEGSGTWQVYKTGGLERGYCNEGFKWK